MAKAAKTKAGDKKKKAKPASKALVVQGAKRKGGGSKGSSGFKDFGRLLETPLFAELLAVGAMAAVGAIADSRARDKDGKKSSQALKAAGNAAAAAVGRRLMTEVDEIRKASKKNKG
jgi:hypothetical protein